MRKIIPMIKRKRWLVAVSMLLSFPLLQAQELTKLRIDPSKAYGGVVSEYFDEIEYIPLETTKESLFGYISNLIITDSSLVILDSDTRSVLFFTPDGKFISKVSKTGRFSPVFIDYNKEDNFILIGCSDDSGMRGMAYNYSLKGKYISAWDLSDQTVKKVNYSLSLDKLFSAVYNKEDLSDLGGNKFSFDYFHVSGGSYLKPLITYNIRSNLALLTLTNELPFKVPLASNGVFYFSTPLEHIVYRCTKDTAIKAFQFVFPVADQVERAILKIDNKKQLDSVIQTSWFKDNTILTVSNITVHKEKIYFMLNKGGFGFAGMGQRVDSRNFIYDNNTKKLSALERITPDASTDYLPILEPQFISVLGVLNKNEYCYSHVSSLRMFAAREATKSKSPQYPPVLQEYFKTQNRKSNPVIVKMKLKE